MATVNEYVRMAQDAKGDNAHVAVLMYYRSAIETAGCSSNAAPVLLAAVQYAQQRLKKDKDRIAVAEWGIEALGKMGLGSDLEEKINIEIIKLQAKGDVNAASP